MRRYLKGNVGIEGSEIVIDSENSIACKFEPKRSFRWIFEIDGVDAFLLKGCGRPAFKIVDGKRVYDPLEITLYDAISPSGAWQVWEWLSEEACRNAYLKMVDETGQDIERWIYEGLMPVYVDFGKLDYEDERACTIYLVLEYDDVKLEY